MCRLSLGKFVGLSEVSIFHGGPRVPSTIKFGQIVTKDVLPVFPQTVYNGDVSAIMDAEFSDEKRGNQSVGVNLCNYAERASLAARTRQLTS
jgi:hypothetical protein